MNKNKPGRKATTVNEIADHNFTIVDLININLNVKVPTIRTHVTRNVNAGRYKITGSQKTGNRGKPSIVYTFNTPTPTPTTEVVNQNTSVRV